MWNNIPDRPRSQNMTKDFIACSAIKYDQLFTFLRYVCFSGTTMDQFKIMTNWLLYKITEDTLARLFNKGYTSVAALKLIVEQDLTELRSVINMGQITLLRGFILCLNCKRHQPIFSELANKSEDKVEQDPSISTISDSSSLSPAVNAHTFTQSIEAHNILDIRMSGKSDQNALHQHQSGIFLPFYKSIQCGLSYFYLLLPPVVVSSFL